ncbi:MAG: hypothetical protein K6F15_01505 [Treponema sp.]|nr:hypothetical protein [Treponema sp.]
MKKISYSFAFLILLLPFNLCAYNGFRNSVYDYQNNVIDFSDEGIPENIVDSRAVTYSPLDLKAGDIFLDANGNALKVVSVTVSSTGSIDIQTVQPTLREVFQYIDIPEQSIEFDPSDFIIFGEDKTEDWNNGDYMLRYDDEGNWNDGDSSRASQSGGMLGDIFTQTTLCPNISVSLSDLGDVDSVMEKLFKYNKEAQEKAAKEAYEKAKAKGYGGKFGGSASLDVEIPYRQRKLSMTGNVDLPYTSVITRRKTWKFWTKSFWTKENWYHKGSAKCHFEADIQLGVALDLTLSGSYKTPKIPIFATPPMGFNIGFYMWPSVKAKASAAYQKYEHFIYDGGMNCDLDGEYVACVPHNFSTTTYKKYVGTGQSLSGSVAAALTVLLGPQAGISIAGISVADITAQAGISAKVAVPSFSSVEFSDIHLNDYGESAVTITPTDTNSVKNLLTLDWSKISFKVTPQAAVSVSAINGLLSSTLWSWQGDPLASWPK